jgi:hypothetical protein
MIIKNNTFIILLILYSCYTIAMEQTIKNSVDCEYIPQLTENEIAINLRQISLINKNNERKFLKYLHKNITDPHKEKVAIEKKLLNIRQEINLELLQIIEKIDRYERFCTDIQKYSYIPGDLFTYITNILDKAIQNHQENDFKLNIQADKKIPSYFVSLLKENLNENNIPSSAVCFHCTNNNRYKSPHIFSALEGHQLFITLQEPGFLNIEKKIFLNTSLEAQKGYCFNLIHEFNWMLIKLKLFLILSSITNDNVNQNDFFADTKRFHQIHLLIVASKNKEKASILKNFLKEVYNQHFSMDDYKKLFKIDRLHRILAWLEEHK